MELDRRRAAPHLCRRHCSKLRCFHCRFWAPITELSLRCATNIECWCSIQPCRRVVRSHGRTRGGRQWRRAAIHATEIEPLHEMTSLVLGHADAFEVAHANCRRTQRARGQRSYGGQRCRLRVAKRKQSEEQASAKVGDGDARRRCQILSAERFRDSSHRVTFNIPLFTRGQMRCQISWCRFRQVKIRNDERLQSDSHSNSVGACPALPRINQSQLVASTSCKLENTIPIVVA